MKQPVQLRSGEWCDGFNAGVEYAISKLPSKIVKELIEELSQTAAQKELNLNLNGEKD